MQSNFFQNGIVLLQLKTLSSIFPVLGGDVAGCTRHATVFVLSALHDYLDAITFLCHEMFRKTERKGKRFFDLTRAGKEKFQLMVFLVGIDPRRPFIFLDGGFDFLPGGPGRSLRLKNRYTLGFNNFSPPYFFCQMLLKAGLQAGKKQRFPTLCLGFGFHHIFVS